MQTGLGFFFDGRLLLHRAMLSRRSFPSPAPLAAAQTAKATTVVAVPAPSWRFSPTARETTVPVRFHALEFDPQKTQKAQNESRFARRNASSPDGGGAVGTGLAALGGIMSKKKPTSGCASGGHKKQWSERRDSNSRPFVPQTNALTRLRYVPMWFWLTP